MSNEKQKKIVFSEEIDSSITGFALGISFVLVALFIYFGGIFHNKIAENIFTIVLLLFGIFGTFAEIEKISHNGIVGISDVVLGAIISVISIFIIIKIDKIILNVIFCGVLLFGVFGATQGILRIVYSIKIQKRKHVNKKVEIFKIIAGVTEITALAVAIIQLFIEVIKIA